MLEVISVILTFAPFILILWLANLGQRLRERDLPYMPPVVVAYTFLILLYLFLALGGFVLLIAWVVFTNQPELITQAAPAMLLKPDSIASWPWLVFGTLIPALLGLALLLKPVRRFCARFLAIDPGHPVHTVALSMSMMAIISMGFTMGIGLRTLSVQVAEQMEQTGAAPISLATLWVQALMFVLTALIGVGWLSRRSFRAALTRLGVVRPTGRQVLIGLGLAPLLALAVISFEALINVAGLGMNPDVEALTEQLLGPLFASPIGILSVGLAAAIGEEPLFRGAIQPRFGILVTALLFAVVHNNYGFSFATLVVFGLGLVLGLVRVRYNTTTAMITHALYNSILGTMAYLAAQYVMQQQ